jgi:hypothetical protein
MPIDLTRKVGISQARQGGFSAHTLPEAVPYAPVVAKPFGMGWLYHQEIYRASAGGSGFPFGLPQDYFRLTAFTANGAGYAQITEQESGKILEVDTTFAIPVKGEEFIMPYFVYRIGGTSFMIEDYYVGASAFHIKADTVSVVTLSSAAKTRIYDKYWNALYPGDESWNDVFWRTAASGGEVGIFGSNKNVRDIYQRCGDGSFFQDSGYTASFPPVRVSVAAGSAFGNTPVGSVPNSSPTPSDYELSPWLRLPGSQPDPEFRVEYEIASTWTAIDGGHTVTTARDMADFQITTSMAGPWGDRTSVSPYGGHAGEFGVMVSYSGDVDYTSNWAALGMTL